MSYNPLPPIKFGEADKIHIYRDSSGILKAKIKDKDIKFIIKPIRCFPITGPDYYVGLFKVGVDGRIKEEIVLISDFRRLEENTRKLIEEELNKTKSLSRIKKVNLIKEIGGKWIWHVDTDNGSQLLDIQTLTDIDMIQSDHAVIKDAKGERFQINFAELDPKSRSQLENFI